MCVFVETPGSSKTVKAFVLFPFVVVSCFRGLSCEVQFYLHVFVFVCCWDSPGKLKMSFVLCF